MQGEGQRETALGEALKDAIEGHEGELPWEGDKTDDKDNDKDKQPPAARVPRKIYKGFLGVIGDVPIWVKSDPDQSGRVQVLFMGGPSVGLKHQRKASDIRWGDLDGLRKLAVEKFGYRVHGDPNPETAPATKKEHQQRSEKSDYSPVLGSKFGRADGAAIEVVKNLREGLIYVQTEFETDDPVSANPILPTFEFVGKGTKPQLDDKGRPTGKHIVRGEWVLTLK